MKSNRIPLVLVLFTAVCWSLAFGFSRLAGDAFRIDISKVSVKFPGFTYSSDTAGGADSQDAHDINESKSTPVANVERVEIDVDGANVDIEVADTADISAKLTGNSTPVPTFTLERSGGNVKVIVDHDSNSIRQSLRLKITLPKTYERALSLDIGAGNVELKRARLGDVDIDMGSGNLSVASRFHHLSIDNGAGNIELENAAGDQVDISTGAGNVSLDASQMHSVRVRVGAGNIDVDIGEPAHWTVRAKAGIGSVGGNLAPEGGRSLQVGKGKRTLDVETAVGNVEVD